jgi:hypothetical protein
MVAEIFGGISAFKTMFDIAKSMKDMNDASIRNGAVIDLQEQILSAQAFQSELAEQVRSLKTEIANFETWETEKNKYELKAIAPTAFAYVYKSGPQFTEPPHWLCANCYQNRKKSFLQYVNAGPAGKDHLKHVWGCGLCKGQIMVHYSVNPGSENSNAQ